MKGRKNKTERSTIEGAVTVVKVKSWGVSRCACGCRKMRGMQEEKQASSLSGKNKNHIQLCSCHHRIARQQNIKQDKTRQDKQQ